MNEIKIVSISDIHGNLDFKLPNGYILTISGDICPVKGSHSPTAQAHWINNYFFPWCTNLLEHNKFMHIVFIAGNHDFIFQALLKNSTGIFKLQYPERVHYLKDSLIDIDGAIIYGTPWTPTFGNWAFMNSEHALDNYFSKIPNNVDILLSHGPMQDYNDTIMQYPERTLGRDPHIGSSSLKKHVLRTLPKYVLVGHIHSGSHEPIKVYNSLEDFEKYSISVNVSLLNENYEIGYKPFEFTLIKE